MKLVKFITLIAIALPVVFTNAVETGDLGVSTAYAWTTCGNNSWLKAMRVADRNKTYAAFFVNMPKNNACGISSKHSTAAAARAQAKAYCEQDLKMFDPKAKPNCVEYLLHIPGTPHKIEYGAPRQ